MLPRTVTAILFDWDGTLCDSAAASLRAFRKSLAEFGVAFTDAEYKAVYTPRWYRMYQSLGLPEHCWERADQQWLHHYREEAPELLPGASEVLDLLRRREIQLGVVTNGTRGRIERELARLGLSSTFQAVVCCEDVTQIKPHPEGVEQALALLGCSRQACCYVGDAPEDIQAGKSARVLTVAVRSEYVDDHRLEACCPDAILANVEELPGILA